MINTLNDRKFSIFKRLSPDFVLHPGMRMLVEAIDYQFNRLDLQGPKLQTSALLRLGDLLFQNRGARTPIHMLVQAEASDSQISVCPMDTYCLEQSREGLAEKIEFRPTSTYTVHPLRIKYLVQNQMVKEITERGDVLNWGQTFSVMGSQLLLVGMETGTTNVSTGPLPICFETENNDLLPILPFLRCVINEKSAYLSPGFEVWDTGGFFKGPSEQYVQEINAFYQHRFVTIGRDETGWMTGAPAVLKKAFDDQLPAEFDQLIWLVFHLPKAMVGAPIRPRLNCFPIVNLSINEGEPVNFQGLPTSHVFRLSGNGYFHSIHSVTGGGKPFIASSNPVDFTRGSYHMTHHCTNINKELLALELRNLSYLMDAQRPLFLDTLTSIRMGEMEATLQKLQDFIHAFQEDQLKPETRFVVVNTPPPESGKAIRVKFWTTWGQLARPDESGALLQLDEGQGVSQLTVLDISDGGIDSNNQFQALAMLSSGILSRNTLITALDLKNYCLSKYGSLLEEVRIRKSANFEVGKQGLERIIVVELLPKTDYRKNHWSGIKDQLEKGLNVASNGLYPIRVQILKN